MKKLEMCEGIETETYLHIRTGNALFALRPVTIEDIKENYIRKPSVEKMIKFVLVWWGRNKCKQEASFGCNGERCEQMVYLREPNFVKLAKTIIKELGA